jgi:hypothetical protein
LNFKQKSNVRGDLKKSTAMMAVIFVWEDDKNEFCSSNEN